MFNFLNFFAVASIGACSVSLSPTNFETNVSDALNFSITNNDEGGNPIRYIRVTSPSSNFVITSANGSQITGAGISDSIANIKLNDVDAGSSVDLGLGITTLSNAQNSSSWNVSATDDVDGNNLVGCSGDTSVSITSPGQASVGISNLSVAVSDSSATMTWNTAVSATSNIEYGTTEQYGVNRTGSTQTSHSINLASLSADTSYYYRVTNTDENGNVAQVAGSFRTAIAGINTETIVTTTTTVTNTVNITKTLTDTTPPTVRFKTEFKKIYEEAPFVEIVSTDGTGIARIEYSIDGGENYLPIGIETIGSKQVSSEFTPDAFEDGDYSLQVRVTDTTGNKVLSKVVKFTIDRLPPRVGPLTVMAGPLIIGSNNTGSMDLLIGVEYKFILTSAGGPNKISLSCNGENYEFNKNNDIGVWTAKVKFSAQGGCATEIIAEDGAGNIETVDSELLTVNSLGKLENGMITIYWYDDYEKKFVRWDGEPYGQINPNNTSDLGGYSFLLPKGKYYLESRAVGKRTSVSNIIDVAETSYVNDDWELSPAWKFWQLREQKIITPKVLGSNAFQNVSFALPKVNLNNLSTLDIRGKSTVVNLLSSWHPTTNNYLKVMDELAKNKYSVYPILVQEKESSATALKRRGGYFLNIYADQDGEILVDTSISGLPTTWIVNRFGQVVKTKVGEASYQEIVNELNRVD